MTEHLTSTRKTFTPQADMTVNLLSQMKDFQIDASQGIPTTLKLVKFISHLLMTCGMAVETGRAQHADACVLHT